jgi:hypothetical protein
MAGALLGEAERLARARRAAEAVVRRERNNAAKPLRTVI